MSKKFLIIRFSSIGDVVLVAPAVAALHAAFPDAQIDLLTKKHIAPIWRGDKRVSVRSFDADGSHYGLPGFFRFLRELRAERYDAVIDLHGLPKSRALCAALGRTTYRYEKASFARRRYVRTKELPAEIVHTARRYVRALAPLGIDPEAPLDPEIFVEDRARDSVAKYVKAVGIQGRQLVAIAPASQWETKQWGWARFGELIPKLNALGLWVALVGGPEDKLRCEELAVGHRALNFAGLLNLQETLALMDSCRLMITNDSGPMHMAGARGVDVIGLFGSTTKPLGFWPLAAKSSVLEVDGLACRPCSPHGLPACPEGHFRCMRDLSVDRVWQEIMKFLGPPPDTDDSAGDEGLFLLSGDD